MEDYGRKLLESLVARRQLKGDLARDILKWSLEQDRSPEFPLIERGHVAREAVLAAKAALLGVETVDLTVTRPDPAAASLLPQAMAQRYRAICLSTKGDEMLLVMDDPTDVFAITYIKMRTGYEVQVRGACSPDIDDALARIYAQAPVQGVAPESLRRRMGQEAVRARRIHLPDEGQLPKAAPARPDPARPAAPVEGGLPVTRGTRVPASRVKLGGMPEGERNRRLAALARASTHLVTALDEGVMVKRLLETAVSVFEVEAAVLFLIDGDSLQLFFREEGGPVQRRAITLRLSPHEENSIAAWAVEERRSIRVMEVSSDPRDNKRIDETFGYTTRSLVAVPLLHGDDVLGVLEVLNKHGRPFDETDVSDLEILASQGSVALAHTLILRQLHNFYHQAVETIIELYQAFDPVSHQHVFDVARLATTMGQAMGLGGTDMETLCYAALLHDIGKARCAAPGDPDHAVLGAQTLEHIALFRRLAPVVRHHHERFDGAGTPDGLAGDEIPLLARILTVANGWHEEVARGAPPDVDGFCERFGSQFDPALEAPLRSALEGA